MRHDLLSIEALVGVGDEQFTDEVLCLRGDGRPRRRVEVILAALNLLKELEVILVVERWGAREQDEEDDGHAPEIASIFVRLLGKNFGCDVTWRAARCGRQLFFVDEASEAEVRYLNDRLGEVLLREEQVLGLDVPVDDAKLVAIDKGIKDRCNNVTSLCLRKSFLLQDLIEQL